MHSPRNSRPTTSLDKKAVIADAHLQWTNYQSSSTHERVLRKVCDQIRLNSDPKAQHPDDHIFFQSGSQFGQAAA